MELAKSFEPHEIEKRWYAHWEGAGYYGMGREEGKPFYCILLPPPNVTGTLHMGHAFQHGLMDALTRYRRMRGENNVCVEQQGCGFRADAGQGDLLGLSGAGGGKLNNTADGP